MSQNVSTAVMQRRHEAVDSLDYFPTPPWATRAFMREYLKAQHRPEEFRRVWEPACGEGHMAEVLREFAPEVLASDVHDYGCGHVVGSFIGEGVDVRPSWDGCQWVITNPPFNLAVEFAERALCEAEIGVALLVRSAWAEGADRFERLFRRHRPSAIVQYCDRVPMVKGRWDPAASSATSYSWFVWEKEFRHDCRPPYFYWIEPGARERNASPADLKRWAA